MSKKWDPSSYGIENAMDDVLCKENGPDSVTFTENGVMKEYDRDDGSCRIDEFTSNPNDPRGHDSVSYEINSDGTLNPSKSYMHKH